MHVASDSEAENGTEYAGRPNEPSRISKSVIGVGCGGARGGGVRFGARETCRGELHP